MGGKMVPLQKYIRCSARPSASLRLLKNKNFDITLKWIESSLKINASRPQRDEVRPTKQQPLTLFDIFSLHGLNTRGQVTNAFEDMLNRVGAWFGLQCQGVQLDGGQQQNDLERPQVMTKEADATSKTVGLGKSRTCRLKKGGFVLSHVTILAIDDRDLLRFEVAAILVWIVNILQVCISRIPGQLWMRRG